MTLNSSEPQRCRGRARCRAASHQTVPPPRRQRQPLSSFSQLRASNRLAQRLILLTAADPPFSCPKIDLSIVLP